MSALTIPTVAEASGISYRQANYWASCGYLGPELVRPGTGMTQHLDIQQARRFILLAGLVRSGLTPAAAVALMPDVIPGTGFVDMGWYGVYVTVALDELDGWQLVGLQEVAA